MDHLALRRTNLPLHKIVYSTSIRRNFFVYLFLRVISSMCHSFFLDVILIFIFANLLPVVHAVNDTYSRLIASVSTNVIWLIFLFVNYVQNSLVFFISERIYETVSR